MIVVKVELHSAITGQITTIAQMRIANDGTGTPTHGNYWMQLFGKNTNPMKRRYELKGWPRKAKHVWALVAEMLKQAYP